MSRRLEDHLYPAGTKSDSTLQPSVLDSDGATISYTSSKRKTTEVTVVDVGNSANSNTGDPLRNAFIKINNFIEASYWTNETVARDMDEFERRLDSDEILIADHTKRLDSDEAMLQYLSQEVDKLINQNDSDESALQFLQTQMDRHEQRLDSDEAAIQALNTYVRSSVALEIFDSTGAKLKTIYGNSSTP